MCIHIYGIKLHGVLLQPLRKVLLTNGPALPMISLDISLFFFGGQHQFKQPTLIKKKRKQKTL